MAEASHKELDQNLEYIESQQTEMSQLLESLDSEVAALCNQMGTNATTTHIDDQRQKRLVS